MEGLKLATIYGLKPHELGFCGPKVALKQKVLRGFILRKVSKQKSQRALQKFEGAYPYYQLIAKSNGMSNPFNEKVVHAYWIGNEFLDNVRIDDLRKMVAKKFSRPGLLAKGVAMEIANSISAQAKPHHSMHVYLIGSVTGKVDLSDLNLKDLCRVSWGKVLEIIDNKIVVEYQPIINDQKLKLGAKKRKEIIWDKEIISKIKIGDRLSFHWNLAIQILTEKDIKNLQKYTLLNISG